MMGRIEKAMFFTILAALVALLLLMLWQSFAKESTPHAYNISVLVRTPSERFLKGVDQAALDYNADVLLVSGYAQGSGEQQAEYFQRELQNNADAVVLQAEDADYMQEYLEPLWSRTPVITVGQRLTSARVALHVGADDTELGRALGNLVAERAAGEVCLVLCPSGGKPYVTQRLSGLTETFRERGVSYSMVYCSTGEGAIEKALAGREHAALAVLDESMLLPLCKEGWGDVKLFGVGYVSEARTQLESGRLTGLIVYSEFDAGYLSLREAVREADREGSGKDVLLRLYVADADAMYQEPVQQVLFPIG